MGAAASPEGHARLEQLVAHRAWLRRLALRLVADESFADDLVQEAYLAALRRPPNGDDPRPWLARVLRNAVASGARSASRRAARERESAREERLPSTAELVAEAGAAQALAAEVLALEEPYRSVLLLRYWRGRSPREIAGELGRPLGTVKTQLQRGLDHLRRRLDRRGEGAGLALLLPLVRRTTPASTLSPVSLAVAVAAVVAVVAGAVAVLAPAYAPGVAVARSGSAPAARADARPASGEGPVSEPGRAALPASGGRAAGAPTESAAAPEPAPEFAGAVLDLRERPLRDLAVAWRPSDPLRWANADRTVLSGARVWLQVDEAERERLRRDPAGRAAFVERNFPPRLRAEASALLRGVELPLVASSRTDAGGRFVFRTPEALGELELLDPALGVAGRVGPPAAATWYVAPTWRLRGTVCRPDGTPRAGVRVELQVPEPAALAATGGSWRPREYVASSGPDGTFELDGVPGTARLAYALRFRAGDATPAGAGVLELPAVDGPRVADGLVLELLEDARPTVVLAGRVLHADGDEARRALVLFGSRSTWTDSDGAYALELSESDLAAVTGGAADDVLFAAEAGQGIVRRTGLAPLLQGRRGTQRVADLVLPHAPSTLVGRVVDPDGAPLAGVAVTLTGTTPVPDLERSLEDVAGRRYDAARIEARTDDAGGFVLPGLEPRAYDVLVRSNAHAPRDLELAAGGNTVTIVLVPSD